MLIVMKQDASHEEVAGVVKVIEALGYEARPMGGRNRTAVGIVGNDGAVDPGRFVGMPGVRDAVPVSKPYKQVSREWKEDRTVVELPGLRWRPPPWGWDTAAILTPFVTGYICPFAFFA